MARYRPQDGRHRRDEVVLLQLGIHPDPPERAPREVVGYENRPQGPDYADRVSSVERLMQLVEESGGEENLGREFYRHNGVDYTWTQFAYRAEHDEYQRLHDSVRALVNVDVYRPWFIRGVIQKGPTEAKAENIWFITIASEHKGLVPKVRAFFEMTPEFATISKSWTEGEPVAIILSNVRDADWAQGVNGDLDDPADLLLLNYR